MVKYGKALAWTALGAGIGAGVCCVLKGVSAVCAYDEFRKLGYESPLDPTLSHSDTMKILGICTRQRALEVTANI